MPIHRAVIRRRRREGRANPVGFNRQDVSTNTMMVWEIFENFAEMLYAADTYRFEMRRCKLYQTAFEFRSK